MSVDKTLDTIFSSVEKAYPGITSEGHTFDVFSFKGAINPLVVQVRASAMNSNALITASTSDSFQAHMVATPGLQLNKIGTKTFIASLPPGGVSIAGGYKTDFIIDDHNLVGDWSEGRFGCSQRLYDCVKDYFNTKSSTSVVPSKSGLYVRKLSDDVSVNVNETTVFDMSTMLTSVPAQQEIFDADIGLIFDHFGITPEMAIACKFNGAFGLTGTITAATGSADFITYPDRDGKQWEALLEKYSLVQILMSTMVYGSAPGLGNIRSMPTIPGYSRVFIQLGVAGTGADWTLMTYVKGDAWQDITYGQHPSFHRGGHYRKAHRGKIPSHSFPQGKSERDFPVPKGPTTHAISVHGLSYSELESFSKRNGNVYSSAYEGCTLFGAPYVDLVVTGDVSTVDRTVMLGDQEISVSLHEVLVDQFRWVVTKDWYKDYLTTGYKIFTPRASNIQTKVLAEWEKLDYNEIVIRGLSEPYEFQTNVSTLPEARIYAKGRAKACKTNDWLQQYADADRTYTWGQVKSKSEAYGPRSVFMSPQNTLVVSSGSITKSEEPVTYKKVDGVIVRTVGGVDTTIDPQNEDDRGVLLYDKYFGKTTLTAVTWDELIIEDSLEKESMADVEEFDFSTNSVLYGDQVSNELIGFGSWIDPFPKGDITDLNDEQMFRLHIKNLMELDRMTGPLVKVINSFGFDTIIKFTK